jgi:hypothetical protein
MDVSINYLNWQVTAVANNTYRIAKKAVDKLRSLIILLASALSKINKGKSRIGSFQWQLFSDRRKVEMSSPRGKRGRGKGERFGIFPFPFDHKSPKSN